MCTPDIDTYENLVSVGILLCRSLNFSTSVNKRDEEYRKFRPLRPFFRLIEHFYNMETNIIVYIRKTNYSIPIPHAMCVLPLWHYTSLLRKNGVSACNRRLEPSGCSLVYWDPVRSSVASAGYVL